MSEILKLEFEVPDGESQQIAALVEATVRANQYEVSQTNNFIRENPGGSFKSYDQERMVKFKQLLHKRVSQMPDESLPLYVQYSSDEEKVRYKTHEATVLLEQEGLLDEYI